MHAPFRTSCLLLWTWLAAVCLLARCQELPTEPEAPDVDASLPFIVNDTAMLPEDGDIQINVLANDSSRIAGDTLHLAQILQPPVHGTATIEEDQIRYTPNLNFNGLDSLMYQVTGSLLPGRGQVFFNVSPVNDHPVAQDDQFTIEEGFAAPKTARADLDVLSNDEDLDGDVLVVSQVSVPNVGQAIIGTGGGGIIYTPPPEFAGSVAFTYIVSDQQGGVDTAAVQVEVTAINDVPIATNDVYQLTEDDQLTVSAPGILGNDLDAEGQPLTLALVDSTRNGALTLSPDGAFMYVPDADFAGTDRFTYTVSDGLLTSALAQVSLTVLQVNDSPVAVNDTYTADVDETIIVQAPGILANDTDVENNPLSARQVSTVTQGTLDFRLDGSFIYTPNAGFKGDDQFTYRATDGTLSNIATVILRIRSTNNPPVSVNDTYSLIHDTILSVPAPGVLSNDADADGNTLTAALATPPQNGTLVLRLNGSLTYTPNAGFAGTDTFTYRAQDADTTSGIATVTLNVTNTPPIAENDSYSISQNNTLGVAAPGVIANDRDGDGDAPLRSTLDVPPANGTVTLNADGSFVYTPNTGFTGTDTFTYRITDGIDNSEPGMVEITVSL